MFGPPPPPLSGGDLYVQQGASQKIAKDELARAPLRAKHTAAGASAH
jgi:hypothetical protein